MAEALTILLRYVSQLCFMSYRNWHPPTLRCARNLNHSLACLLAAQCPRVPAVSGTGMSCVHAHLECCCRDVVNKKSVLENLDLVLITIDETVDQGCGPLWLDGCTMMAVLATLLSASPLRFFVSASVVTVFSHVHLPPKKHWCVVFGSQQTAAPVALPKMRRN